MVVLLLQAMPLLLLMLLLLLAMPLLLLLLLLLLLQIGPVFMIEIVQYVRNSRTSLSSVALSQEW